MKKAKNSKNKSEEIISWVNIHDDNAMRKMGLIRSSNKVPRDESVWTKTPQEKRILKKVRNSGKDMHFHTSPKKFIKVWCKLIINLIKNKQFNKTTYSTECWQHEIPHILSKFTIDNNKTGLSKSAIRNYYWNGKTYEPNDLPFSR